MFVVVGLGLAASIGMLVAGQILAVVTGLADGRTRPEGLPWMLVAGSLAIYSAALVFLGITGVLLSRDLFRYREPQPTP